MNITVNIVTITFNSEKFIEQTILSVLGQTYAKINYIIIDGGSKDTTIDIILKYKSKLSVFVSEPDNGIADAFNKGLRYCHDGLVGFLNSDDFFSSPNSISMIVDNYIDEKTIICGSLNLVNLDGIPVKKLISRPYLLPFGMYILHPTMYTPVSLAKRIGEFNLDYSIAIDYDWTLRALKKKAKFKVNNVDLINMRIGGTSNDIKTAQKEERIIRSQYYNCILIEIFIFLYKKFRISIFMK